MGDRNVAARAALRAQARAPFAYMWSSREATVAGTGNLFSATCSEGWRDGLSGAREGGAGLPWVHFWGV